MLFNIEFSENFKYSMNDDISFNIHYYGNNQKVEQFFKLFPKNKKITLLIENLEDFILEEKFNFYEDFDYNFVLSFYYADNDLIKSFVKKLCKENIPFLFRNIVTSWEQLNYYISLGVSEVFIGEDLGFSIKGVSQVCKKNNIKLRLAPNVSQAKYPPIEGSLISFYIRPEAIKLYEAYVDEIEFWGNKESYNTIYEIYKSEKWFGDLSEIILGLKESINNRALPSLFDTCRLNCNHKCIKGSSCQECYKLKELAETLGNNNMYLK